VLQSRGLQRPEQTRADVSNAGDLVACFFSLALARSAKPQDGLADFRSRVSAPWPGVLARRVLVCLAMKNLIFVLVLASFANAQATLRNSVTFSVGPAFNDSNRPSGRYDTTLGLGATYDYRVFRHLQIEAGITTALHPTAPFEDPIFGIQQPTDRFTWVPFGLQGVLPLRAGRLEVFAGGGGMYENYSAGNLFPLLSTVRSQDAWRGYFKFGATAAIGRSRHFWLGASAREFLGDQAQGLHWDQWVVVTADVSFRF
jgi:hypothetical protein